MSLVSSNPGQLDGSSVCLRLLWSWHCWRTMVSSFISGPQFDCLTFSHEETEVIEFWQEGRRSDVCHSYCITSEGTWCPHITTLNFLHKEVVLMMMARLSPDLTCPVPSPCSTPRSNPADSHFWLWSFSLSLMSFGHLDLSPLSILPWQLLSLSVFLVWFLPPHPSRSALEGWLSSVWWGLSATLSTASLQHWAEASVPWRSREQVKAMLGTVTIYLGWTSNSYWVTEGDKDTFHSSSPSCICWEGFRTQVSACVIHLCSPSNSHLAMAKTSLRRGSLWPKAGVFRVRVLAFNVLELLILL